MHLLLIPWFPLRILLDLKVGDKISEGQPLLAIDDSILQSQLKQAQAQLDALNIDIVKSKTSSSLQSLYVNSLSAAQKSVTTAKNIFLFIFVLFIFSLLHYTLIYPHNIVCHPVQRETRLYEPAAVST